MESVEKKNQPGRKKRRWLVMVILVACASCAVIVSLLLPKKSETELPQSAVSTYGKLIDKTPEEVAQLTVALPTGEEWTIARHEGNMWVMENGAPDYEVAEGWKSGLLSDAAVVDYLDVLAEDFSEFEENASDFGLNPAKVTAEVTYTDGTSAKFFIGGETGLEDGSLFMTLEGDPRLFAIDKDKLTILRRDAKMFRQVNQPVIHAARIDRVEIARDGQDNVTLVMDADIADEDALDRWILTEPFCYAADGEKIRSLLSTAESLRLGAFVGDESEMTAEERTLYGVDSPRMTVTFHLSPGSIGNPDSMGQYQVTDYGENVVTISLLNEISDVMDYVSFSGAVYMMNHFQMSVFLSLEGYDLASRYPVVVALDTLKTLEIRENGTVRTYAIAEGENAENSENEEIEKTVTCGNAAVSYEKFESEYDRLSSATVSGRLPDGWKSEEEPHTQMIFTNIRGEIHTIELTTFDPLHDAVTVDGNTAFYIIKGGLSFSLS